MRRHRGDDDKGEALNITPMIDVVFLLLIFFIATIQLPDPEDEMRAYLPREEQQVEGAGDEVEDQERQVITHMIVLEPGSISMDNIPLPTWSALQERLDSLRLIQSQSEDVRHEIVLAASAGTPYRQVIRALETCARYGFQDVNFGIPPGEASGQ
jgi:biopolymer transport protein ExbD